MKFRRKPVISSVNDAEQYKPGMEEDFESRYRDVNKHYHTRETSHSSNDIPVQVPYLYLKNEVLPFPLKFLYFL